MPNIIESSVWEEGVRRIETGDPVAGGDTAPANLALQDLANRTLYLKNEIEDLLTEIATLGALIGNTSMNDVLLKANNLADIPNKNIARTNLGAADSSHTHSTYLGKNNNLSDISDAAAGRQNLGVGDFLFGSGVPSLALGKNGDLYVRTDLTYLTIYKKTSGIWTLQIANTDIPGNAATATLAALATIAQSCSGNAASATKLQTARTINGVSFSGEQNIVLPAHSALLKAQNGYINLHVSGLIIQWGRSPQVGGDSYLDIAFPIAFPNECFVCTGTIISTYMHKTSEGAVVIGNITKTGFRSVNGADVGGPCAYIAIGY